MYAFDDVDNCEYTLTNYNHGQFWIPLSRGREIGVSSFRFVQKRHMFSLANREISAISVYNY